MIGPEVFVSIDNVLQRMGERKLSTVIITRDNMSPSFIAWLDAEEEGEWSYFDIHYGDVHGKTRFDKVFSRGDDKYHLEYSTFGSKIATDCFTTDVRISKLKDIKAEVCASWMATYTNKDLVKFLVDLLPDYLTESQAKDLISGRETPFTRDYLRFLNNPVLQRDLTGTLCTF